MKVRNPEAGEWYRVGDDALLEVVAFDAAEGAVEVQYFDGTVEEFELADWRAQRAAGTISEAEPPEDWSGSVDVDPEDDSADPDPLGGGQGLRAGSLGDASDTGEYE
jgi:hypothetical protein